MSSEISSQASLKPLCTSQSETGSPVSEHYNNPSQLSNKCIVDLWGGQSPARRSPGNVASCSSTLPWEDEISLWKLGLTEVLLSVKSAIQLRIDSLPRNASTISERTGSRPMKPSRLVKVLSLIRNVSISGQTLLLVDLERAKLPT